MSASSKDIAVAAKAVREILDQKGRFISSAVSDVELRSIAKYVIDIVDWHRAADEEPKVPKIAEAKK